jgi:hypothetical protein
MIFFLFFLIMNNFLNFKILDSFFNIPGTGAYAILTVGQGCVTAPVGSQNTAYSNAIAGFSMFIALAFIPLAGSLLFLKKDNANYSIYPKKWTTVSRSTDDDKVDKVAEHKTNEDMPLSTSTADADKVTECKTPLSTSTADVDKATDGITNQDIPTTTTDADKVADTNVSRDIPSKTSAAATVSDNSSSIQTPSIYDLISIAQWIVTTALLTLPNLPIGYRQFASNFGWSIGTGGGINVQAFSDAADNLRKQACPNSPALCSSSLQKYDTCKPWFNSDVTPNHLFTATITDGNKTYFKDPTGFDSYSNALHISNNNVFFVMFVALLLAILSALIILLLTGVLAFKMKEKMKILEKVAKNMRLLVFGKWKFFFIMLLFR